MSAVDDKLAALAGEPDERIDVVDGALLIAQGEYPDLDVAGYVARFDELAAAARRRLSDGAGAENVARLNAFLFRECGFVGNAEDYYDPRNSYLNDVLDRRTGIPITLSIVYSEVARRVGLPVHGVGFPGHFLVKYAGDEEIIVDPFGGAVISASECERRLRAVYGPEARLDSRFLRAATAREILVRMLRNLKQIYVGRNELDRAVSCISRILLLLPDEAHELRDRGALYQRLECFSSAVKDFERYLELAPQGKTAAAIRETLGELRGKAAQLQ